MNPPVFGRAEPVTPKSLCQASPGIRTQPDALDDCEGPDTTMNAYRSDLPFDNGRRPDATKRPGGPDRPEKEKRPAQTKPPSRGAERPFRWSGYAKVELLYCGVILPIICLQAGTWKAYAQLLLCHKSALAMLPVLVYHMVCLTLVVIVPERAGRSFLVRLGVYSGVATAAVYWVLFWAAAGLPLVVLPAMAVVFWGVTLMAWLVFRAIAGALCRYPLPSFIGFVVLVILASVLEVTVGGAGELILVFSFGVFAISLVCAAYWAMVAYVAASWMLLRRLTEHPGRFSLAQLLGVVTWAAVWLSAWRLAYLWMLRAYATLPAEPPDDCYVATAAARGHGRVVGSRRLRGADGRARVVNRQMQYLKAAELLLAALCPRAHRLLRQIYDRLGPRLAALLVHALLADGAYLLLKPAEWIARVAVWLVVPRRACWLVDALYHAPRGVTSDG